ncbi:28S ribosomal protein S11, mitochondrial [Lingula anatina]|uniref:28S ribosomal protein S11, mitochondrial n=1 Tax=Lingula anatina TaxID=7574 RepID=A0A1S3HTK0_LINAN|nr:28S ribosomal protein S11, mitochondrial [Lingula anatina]|eukprot:XP_013389370.1 28S ribosomal protein S11, mitochondrial [Lingula anatina]
MLRKVFQVTRNSNNCLFRSICEHKSSLQAVECTVLQVPSVGLSTTHYLLDKSIKKKNLTLEEGLTREYKLSQNVGETFYTEFEEKTFTDFSWGRKVFPDHLTGATVVNNVRYDELPIVHMKCSNNNIVYSVTDHTGKQYFSWSGGLEGFKNKKKGSTMAAQASAMSVAKRAVETLGIKVVRVKMRGLGQGRVSALRGLQIGGLSIVSLTDTSSIKHSFLKGRKPRVI